MGEIQRDLSFIANMPVYISDIDNIGWVTCLDWETCHLVTTGILTRLIILSGYL